MTFDYKIRSLQYNHMTWKQVNKIRRRTNGSWNLEEVVYYRLWRLEKASMEKKEVEEQMELSTWKPCLWSCAVKGESELRRRRSRFKRNMR